MELREMAAAAAAAAASSGGGGGGGGGGGRLPPPNPNLPYREDCWSEGETAALVGAWGSRYEDLNRGNLRQKQWQEVAAAVNTRRGAAARRRPPRTDVQCKNRVDTLKKKYKAERARAGPSAWSFYGELDRLVGPTLSAAAAKARHHPSQAPHFALPIHPASAAARRHPSPSSSPSRSSPPRMALPLSDYPRGVPLPTAAYIQQRKAAAAAVSGSDDSGDPADNNNSPQQSPSRSVSSRSGSGNNNKRRRRSSETGTGADAGVGELARAIEAFAEMYERVENAKQKHSLEIERERIDFLKQLEVKRMENFVDAQLKLSRAKHGKKTGGAAAANGITGVELVSSMTALPFLSNSNYL
uniref:Uncharacterized protein n=1 Tax=Avena sativa TaxID=4498 RepID=A0ACD5TDR4_AVESA